MASFLDDEPVLASTAAGAIVSYVLTFLVTHGVITDTTASVVTQTAAPIVAAALVALAGILVRHLVAPAKKVAALLENAGLLTDADFGRIEASITELIEKHLGGATEPADKQDKPELGQPAAAGAPAA